MTGMIQVGLSHLFFIPNSTRRKSTQRSYAKLKLTDRPWPLAKAVNYAALFLHFFPTYFKVVANTTAKSSSYYLDPFQAHHLHNLHNVNIAILPVHHWRCNYVGVADRGTGAGGRPAPVGGAGWSLISIRWRRGGRLMSVGAAPVPS